MINDSELEPVFEDDDFSDEFLDLEDSSYDYDNDYSNDASFDSDSSDDSDEYSDDYEFVDDSEDY